MQLVNNEIAIQRGEGFTLDLQFRNKDDSPFVIGDLAHPYFLVTVTSSKMRQTARYIYNTWCKIPAIGEEYFTTAPRCFYSTSFVDLGDGDGFDDLIENGVEALSEEIQQEIADSQGRLSVDNYAVYTAIVEGQRQYKYCITTVIDSVPTRTLYDYTCDFVLVFEPNITVGWNDREYWYSITLVDGELNSDTEAEQPITTLDFNLPILQPTRLIVTSNSNNLGGLQ